MPQIIDNDAAGPSPTVSGGNYGPALAAGSHDDGGQITWGTPAAPAAGAIFTVNFGTPKRPPVGLSGRPWAIWVELCVGNTAAGGQLATASVFATVNYDATGAATGFTVFAPLAQPANQLAGTYAATYQVIY